MAREVKDFDGGEGLTATAEERHGMEYVKVFRSCDGGRKELSWEDAIGLLRGESSVFRSLLTRVLAAMPYEAFFWECPPVSKAGQSRQRFEFVAIPAPHLVGIEAEPGPFSKVLGPFRGQNVARAFASLSPGITLVSPAAAIQDLQVYTNIASFMKRGPAAQQDALWKEVGKTLQEKLDESSEPIWLSTEGSGTYWLHIRLAPFPKYYHHEPYTHFAEAGGAATELLELSMHSGPAQAKVTEFDGDGGLKATAEHERNMEHVKVFRSHGGDRQELSWADAIGLLRGESGALRSLLTRVLAAMPYKAFFWECPPVSKAEEERLSFEFVVLPAKSLEHITAEPEPFSEHLGKFRGQSIARTFASLEPGTTLVSPVEAAKDLQVYANIGSFMRGAPVAQQDALWKEVGKTLQERLDKSPKPVWLSTEGSGVYWLHIRLDDAPKYYHYQAYSHLGGK